MSTFGVYLSRTRIRIVWTTAFFGVLAMGTSDLWSQGTNATRASHSKDRTRAFIDDISNSLSGDSDFDSPRRTGNRISADGRTFDLKAVRPLIRAFSNSLEQLTYALNEQVQSNPASGLRQVYTESLRLSGTAASISKLSERQGSDGALQDELQQLDADWRELAFRIGNATGNTPGLTSELSELVSNINDADLRIRQSIGIQPQLDRRQLYLKAAGLVADLENLQEDVSSELGNSSNSKVYRQAIGRIRQVALNMIAIIRDEWQESNIIVDEYKQFEALWSPVVAKLRGENDRYIERGLRRVSASAGDVQQLLLLPRKMDQSQSIYLASVLKKDIDEFFERTPLILVMQLPRSKQALGTADQFYNSCAQFTEAVNRSGNPADIVDSFRKIEGAERAFIEVYRDVDSDKAIAVLNRINRSVNSLGASLQIQRDDFNSQSAEDLAAAIQNFTEQIEAAAKGWLGDDRQSFASDCLQDAADLADRAAKLHDDIASGKSQVDLKGEMTELYDTWRRVYTYLAKCQTDDRAALGRLASSLTPAMVDLRTMILQ